MVGSSFRLDAIYNCIFNSLVQMLLGNCIARCGRRHVECALALAHMHLFINAHTPILSRIPKSFRQRHRNDDTESQREREKNRKTNTNTQTNTHTNEITSSESFRQLSAAQHRNATWRGWNGHGNGGANARVPSDEGAEIGRHVRASLTSPCRRSYMKLGLDTSSHTQGRP